MTSLPGLMEISGVPGIAIGLVARGQAIWQAHVGTVDKDGAAVGATTIWKAASLSKQVSCYAALRLADTGALDLDRPLAFYLGEDALPDATARRITARHALTHSSGLPNWRQTREIVPAFAPGSQFRYSGEGYFLLARCIEKITGVGFEAYMQDVVFGPLGMNSSTFLWRPDLPERLAPGHHWEGTPWDDASWRDRLHTRIGAGDLPVSQWTLDRVAAAMTPVSGTDKGVSPLPGAIYYPNPAMSLMTTVADYLRIVARFTTSFGDGLDLSPRLRALVARPLVRVNRAISWGLGWGNEMADGMTYLFQNGSLAGACTSFCLLHPPSETGMVVFTNHINGPRLIDRILRAATGREHPVFLWA
ncbi:MAG: serine hydrolase [Candidatus Sphingomonas phytovorans]|nr:serine hydrolase domain-containing protein [Sphingomonas sp.]WEK01974.1 MAG: serine hydrolase [Sphingomonas sp.]